MYSLQLSGQLLRRFSTNYAQGGNRLASSFGHSKDYRKFGGYRKKISIWMKEQGIQLAQACTRQFEFIAAQRIRRSLQIFHLYTRIWDEVALREFIKSWRYRAMRNTKQFLMSAVGVTMYNWDRERISDQELNSYKQELEDIYKLRESTVVCAKCHLRIIIDNTQPGIKYCTCSGIKSAATSNRGADGWMPYIEKEDMLIWRREEPESQGLFAYKVYGKFSDVTADDFLQVQIDVDYRKKWDATARVLQVIDTDPISKPTDDHSTDVIYWEMKWPKFFTNRDYVYQRRWVVDKEKGLIVIISKVTEHPNAPTRPGIYRVTTYWSFMVIRPYTEFHQPGIEFGLTYFDDPGVNLPSALSAWVASTGLPDYLIRMREASKDYQKYKILEQETIQPSTDYINVEEENLSAEDSKEANRGSTETRKCPKSARQAMGQDIAGQKDGFNFKEEENEINNEDENEGEVEDKDDTSNSPSEDDRDELMRYCMSSMVSRWLQPNVNAYNRFLYINVLHQVTSQSGANQLNHVCFCPYHDSEFAKYSVNIFLSSIERCNK